MRDGVRLEAQRALAIEGADSSHPSTGGWRPSYHGNDTRRSTTPVVTNTVARNPWRSSTGSAASATSAKPSSKVSAIVRSGTASSRSSSSADMRSSTRYPSAARCAICSPNRGGVTASGSSSAATRW